MKKHQSTIKRSGWQIGLASLLVAAAAGRAGAQDIWTGGGTDANWSTAGNWQAGTAPLAGDSLVFAGSSQTTPNNDFPVDTLFNGIVFSPTAAPFTLTGNEATLTGLVENDTTNQIQTINLPLVLSGAVTFNTSSNDVTGANLSDDIAVGGTLSGAGSLIKIGDGTLYLTNKTYSGGTTISNGLVWAENDNGSFTMSGGSYIADYGSYYSGPTFAFTADSSVGTTARGYDRYDYTGNMGSPGFKWTVIGTGRWQTIANNETAFKGSAIEVAAGATLSDDKATTSWGGALVPITVDAGGTLGKYNGTVLPVPNPLILNGTGVNNTGALDANFQSYQNPANNSLVAVFTNTITLASDSSIGVHYNTMSLLGNISGPGALTLIGPGPLLLGGSNSYAGSTTISGGTLQLGSPSALPGTALFIYNNGKLDLNGNNATAAAVYDDGQAQAAIDNSSATPATLTLQNGANFTGAVGNSGGGALSLVNVAGTSSFTGISSFAGGISVLGGSLESFIPTGVTGTGGLLNLADGTILTLDYRVANSSLRATGATLAGASAGITLNVNLNSFGTPAKPVITATNGTGVLNASGTVTINITGTDNLSVGQFPLIKYTTHTGSGAFVLGTISGGITAQIVTNTANKSIDLKITGAPITTWAGTKNNLWDYTTTNWTYAATKVLFADNAALLFNDTAATNIINVTTAVTPGPIQVVTAKNVTFTGNGPLNGGNLTVNGTGTVILDTTNANGYNNTIISAGTLQVGNNDGNGSLGAGTVDDEGILAFNLTNNIAVQNTISGAGTVVNNNSNVVTISGGNSYTGGTLINQGVVKQTLTNSLGLPLPGTPVATVASGAALNLGGASIFATNPVVLNGFGTGAANTGALYSDAGWSFLGGTEMGANAVSLASDASVGGLGNWFAIGNNGVNGLAGNGRNLTKVGGGVLVFKASASSALSSFTIAGGGVYFYNRNLNWLGTGATLIYSNNAYSDSWDPNNWTGIIVPNNIVIANNGGQIYDDRGPYYGQAFQDTYNGSVTLNGNLTLRCTATYGGAPNNVPTFAKQTFNGGISGVGGITATIATGDSVVLNGANTYTGPTVVVGGTTGGKLSLSSIQQGGGTYTVNDGGILDVAGQNGYVTVPMAALNFGSSTGATLSLARVATLNPTNAPVTATNLVLSGVNSIIVAGAAYANAGQYPLIKYGTISGSLANLALGSAGARGIPGYLTNNVANNSIDLVVPGGSPLVWTGSPNNGWDLSATANWQLNGSATVYNPGDAVTFNDSSSVTNVYLTTPVSPSLLIVNNTNKNYTLTGSNITGSTVLLKQGTGTLLLSNGPNTFIGGATIVGGTVKLGNAGSLNNASGTVTVTGNGALDFNFQNPTALAITISGAGFNGLGTVVANYTNAAAANGPASITLAGSATVGGTNRFDIRNGANQLNSPSTNYTLTKVGPGYFGLVGTTVSPNLGDIAILNGTLSYQTGSSGLGNPSNNIYIGNGGKLSFYQAANPLNKNIICSNNAVIQTESGSGGQNNIVGTISLVPSATLNMNYGSGVLNISSPLNIPSGCTVNNNGNYYGTINYSNVISGSGTFYIQYQAYVNLAASNTFAGNITVPQCNSGAGSRLSLLGNGSITHVPSIYMQGIAPGQASPGYISVASRVDGTLTLNANQTLRGDNGSYIVGSVVVGAGATLTAGAIGSTNYQYMGIGNNLTFQAQSTNIADLYKSATVVSNSLVIVTNTLTYGGTLRVYTNNAGVALAAGDSFKLFRAGTYAGSFATITPDPGPGLIWDASKLAVNGTLSVIVNPLPSTGTNITTSLAGNQLTLSWPANYQGWLLQSNSVSLGSSNSWFTVPGSAATTQQVITLDPTQSNVFYRMVHP